MVLKDHRFRGLLGSRNIHKRVRSEFAYNESKKSCRSFLLWIIPAKIIFPNLDNG
jgi:hypothetical protein